MPMAAGLKVALVMVASVLLLATCVPFAPAPFVFLLRFAAVVGPCVFDEWRGPVLLAVVAFVLGRFGEAATCGVGFGFSAPGRGVKNAPRTVTSSSVCSGCCCECTASATPVNRQQQARLNNLARIN